MPSHTRRDRRRPALVALVAAFLVLLLPSSASAHADLQSSEPAQGATVPFPFSGPVVLTFTESLAVGSKADLYGPGHQLVASATIDAGTMTIPTSGALPAGDYTVEWVSIADDGDLLRGTLAFTVAAAASPSTPPTPSAAPSVEPSGEPTSAPSAPSASAATPSPTPGPAEGTSGTGSDVILPIVIALLVAVAGAFYLVRRNRPA
jgi:methionine-rich copper-binding protein CopC